MHADKDGQREEREPQQQFSPPTKLNFSLCNWACAAAQKKALIDMEFSPRFPTAEVLIIRYLTLSQNVLWDCHVSGQLAVEA